MSAYFTSGTMIEENPEVVREAFPKFNENASPQVAAKMALPFWSSELTPADFEEGAELAMRYGFIDEIPDLETFVYTP